MSAGAQGEFERAVRAYSGDLYRFAYWLCRDRFQAEDLVQETYARAWRAWDGLRDGQALKSWLFTILHHEHARAYRRKRVEAADVGADEMELPVLPQFELSLDMNEAVKALPETLREPLLLQVLGGFSGAEIGKMLSIHEGAVMTRLTRARQALRRLLEAGPRGKEVAR